MIVICDNCTTSFYVEGDQLLIERKLKCSKCSYVWLQPPFSLDDSQNDKKKKVKLLLWSAAKKARLLKCMTFLLTSVIVVALLMIPRGEIKPIFRPFYNLFNVYDSVGIGFDGFRVEYMQDGVLIVSKIVNNSDEHKVLPNINVALCDNQDNLLRVINLTSYTRYVGAHSTIELQQHLANLPEGVRYITLNIGNKLELLFR